MQTRLKLTMFLPISFLLNIAICLGDDPLVETNIGVIKGLRATDGNYSMFMGIPYATVDPENPFGPSVPQEKFDDVFEAYDDSAICPQIEEFNLTLVGTLDCLHLNVYVPENARSNDPLPVFVWFYGGGFMIGFAGRFLWGPKYLVRHDVIVVTVNYRLGVYGFMCLEREEIPGNQGIKDQLLALRWVRDNIRAFGGDPDKVTLGGSSAGSISIDFHLMSPQERLFDKVIMHSGTSLLPSPVLMPDETLPIRLANFMGFETSGVDDALSFLTTANVRDVTLASFFIGQTYNLCVENEFDGVERVLTDYPVNLDIPKVQDIPVLIGYTNDEMFAIYYNRDEEFWTQVDVIREILQAGFDFGDEKLDRMESILRRFYIGDEEYNDEVQQRVADFLSDTLFTYPTHMTLNKYLDNGSGNIYFYLFSYVGERNFVKQRENITAGGALHADEIGYLFDISYMTEEPTPEDQLMIDRMTTMWTNFVKYGDPTPEVTELLPVKWNPVTNNTEHYLELDSELTAGRRPLHDRIAFLDLFYKLNEKYIIGFRVEEEDEDDDGGSQSLQTNIFLILILALMSSFKNFV